MIWDSDSKDEVGTGTGMVVGGHGMGKQSCGNVLGIRSSSHWFIALTEKDQNAVCLL